MPPHKLLLKIGMPIMLMRNVSPLQGLCNGTRLIIKEFYERYIVATISGGNNNNNIVIIPKMPLTPTDTGLPFDLKRVQFPIRPAFCMTISKSQGQTLELVGLWLDEPLFSHGQLYVAMSRVSSIDHIKIAIKDNLKFTRNVVYKEVLT
jgi:ATP-dependent exoDNAse (exonuclease V) alpha subunit